MWKTIHIAPNRRIPVLKVYITNTKELKYIKCIFMTCKTKCEIKKLNFWQPQRWKIRRCLDWHFFMPDNLFPSHVIYPSNWVESVLMYREFKNNIVYSWYHVLTKYAVPLININLYKNAPTPNGTSNTLNLGLDS